MDGEALVQRALYEKFSRALREDLELLPVDLRGALVEDLVAAYVERARVFGVATRKVVNI